MHNRSPPSSPRQSKGTVPTNLLITFLLGTFFGFVTSSLFFLGLWDVSPGKEAMPMHSAGSLSGVRNSMTKRGSVENQLQRSKSTNNLSKDDNNGWNSIQVFVGDPQHIIDASTIPADYYVTTRWFSQLRQDYIVSALLRGKREGYFVDLAANDAIRISNTYALERDFGWTGLCIEPNPIYWSSLSYRQNCQTVAAVVGHHRMQEVLFKFGSKGPQSGIVGPDFRNKEPIHNREEKRRSTVTLQEIFERFETPAVIDYLSLDVEGAEEYIMESFPFDKYRFNVLTIEGPSAKLQATLRAKDYSLLTYLRREEETLWVHNKMLPFIDTDSLDLDIPKYSEKVPRTKQ